MNKFATRILVIWSALLLTGCFYQSVDRNDIESGVLVCASNGADLVSVSANFLGGEHVSCSNRQSYLIHSGNLPKKGTL